MGTTAPGKDLRRVGSALAALSVLLLPLPLAAAPREEPIGTVLALPRSDYNLVLAANVTRNLRVRVLHLSRFGAGTFNTEILTLAITHPEPLKPAYTLFLPTDDAGELPRIYRELNSQDTLHQTSVIEAGGVRVAQVRVTQAETGCYIPGQTRFFLASVEELEALRAQNPGARIRLVHRQQMALGAFHVAAALVAIDAGDAPALKVPTGSLLNALLRMNPNVAVQEEAAAGNAPVAAVTVSAQELL